MKNFTNENLINLAPSGVTPGTLAIKIGDTVFVARNPVENICTPVISGGIIKISPGTVETDLVFPYTETTINVTSPVTVEGTVDQQISQVQLSATVSNGGTPTFSSSDLLTGLSMTSGGLITGTPTESSSSSGAVIVSYMNISGQIILNYSIAAAGGGGGGGYIVTGTNSAYDGNYFDSGEELDPDHKIYKHETENYYLTFDNIMAVWVIGANKYSGGPGTYAYTTYQYDLPTEGNPQDLDGGGYLSKG